MSKTRGNSGKDKNAWSWASQLYEEGTPTSTEEQGLSPDQNIVEEQGLSPAQNIVDMHHLYLYIYL